MKIDAIIGNPPYQVTVAQKETDNGQKRSSNIFQHFQSLADSLKPRFSSLIYPAGRWIHQSGKGLAEFGYNQMNDPHLARLHVYPNAADIFTEVGIADGLSIVLKDSRKVFAGFVYAYTKDGQSIEVGMPNPGDTLMTIDPMAEEISQRIQKTVRSRFDYICKSVLSQKAFLYRKRLCRAKSQLSSPLSRRRDATRGRDKASYKRQSGESWSCSLVCSQSIRNHYGARTPESLEGYRVECKCWRAET